MKIIPNISFLILVLEWALAFLHTYLPKKAFILTLKKAFAFPV